MKFGVQTQILVLRIKVSKFYKFKMADGRHIENRLLTISEICCPINTKFCMKKQNHVQTQVKIPNFENSRWRTAAILKMVSSLYLGWESSDFDEIWCADSNFGSKDGHVTKYQNFANSTWWTAAILKIVFDYISTISCPINVKFDMKKQNYVQILVT